VRRGRRWSRRQLPTSRIDDCVSPAEAETGPVLAGRKDQRVTGVGALLRRLRFDELPQIWNVLCGHMSLVGPRPERSEFVAELRNLPDYDLRHLIRPGLTGIAQLTGSYAATAEEKLRCDLPYVNGPTLRWWAAPRIASVPRGEA
jgi:lipopolysaccharide/colanic/teichoic acid biosynthesis glycosyltransferase